MAKRAKEMSGSELLKALGSTAQFKGLGAVRAPGLRLSEEDLAWWREAKLGLFIHWGLYSLLGRGEWAMHKDHIPAEEYAKLAQRFIPTAFSAESWTELAREAGMRYAVMVARHHDGFALWDSPGSYGGFTSVASPAHHDFVADYVRAARCSGLRVGLYYSLADWRFPGYFQPKELLDDALLMKRQTHDQVEELVSRYGTIDIVWYDAAWLAHTGHDPDAAWLWEPVALNRMVRSHNSKTIINPRSGWEGDFYCDEGSHEIKGKIIPVPWEKDFCIGTAWGFIPNDTVMSFEDIVTMVVNVAVRDGNVLLNVGPDPDGVIPDEMVERLRALGGWMRANGDAVYGTRGGPLQPVDGVYGTTYKGRRIYLHVLDFEHSNALSLPPLEQKVLHCRKLRGRALTFSQDSHGLSLTIPPSEREPVDTIVEIELESPVRPLFDEEIILTRP